MRSAVSAAVFLALVGFGRREWVAQTHRSAARACRRCVAQHRRKARVSRLQRQGLLYGQLTDPARAGGNPRRDDRHDRDLLCRMVRRRRAERRRRLDGDPRTRRTPAGSRRRSSPPPRSFIRAHLDQRRHRFSRWSVFATAEAAPPTATSSIFPATAPTIPAGRSPTRRDQAIGAGGSRSTGSPSSTTNRTRAMRSTPSRRAVLPEWYRQKRHRRAGRLFCGSSKIFIPLPTR